MRNFAAPLLVTALLLSACDLATDPEAVSTEAGLSVRSTAGRLILLNQSSAPIHYVAVEEKTAALVDLYFDPSAWPSVPPQAELRIPHTQISGYERGAKRVIVYWWTAQNGYGDLRLNF